MFIDNIIDVFFVITQNVKEKKFDIEISLMSNGLGLKESISDKSSVEVGLLKVICGGRVIDDTVPLHLQNVRVSNCGSDVAPRYKTIGSMGDQHKLFSL